ncbi:VC0807 family protein [Actinomadura macrotermitis]|uniref:Intracellular septation protein A n=1 Tax=Actinomadura macrotermitis TaxID=2585200 RepID=A0A7K0BV86_9ACTN|nr:VC0807 family protein [Actinomadura macrotermitis]MQY04584.1 hypothetical protein [Actinomadura macrotermitis]
MPKALAKIRPLVPLLLDVAVPLALYFALKRLGANDFWALTVAGVSTGAAALVNTVRHRRLDFIGVLVMLELALSVALLFLTGDARVAAAKPAFYTAFTGVFFLVTCFVGRPVVYQAATPMATKGVRAREIAYDRAWLESAEFRLRQRLMTAMFAVVLLAESALRVVIVYSYTREQIERSFVISQLPGIVLIVFVLGYFRLNVPALSRIVDGIQEQVEAGASQT